ncbi:MAG TPA: hypothetical protein VFG54_21780 [Prolixibacteraceae bacterium]|nr:hypothetical protein [Prolixibacteraceae bacterium]
MVIRNLLPCCFDFLRPEGAAHFSPTAFIRLFRGNALGKHGMYFHARPEGAG